MRVQTSRLNLGELLADKQGGLLLLELLLLFILLLLLLLPFHSEAAPTLDSRFGSSIHKSLETFLFDCTQIFIDPVLFLSDFGEKSEVGHLCGGVIPDGLLIPSVPLKRG